MKKNFKILSVALTFVVALAMTAFGQRTTGNVEGTITDANGAVVPGVTVSIKSTGSTTGFSSTTTTNAEGNYTFSQIPAGTYQVSTNKSGFKSTTTQITVAVDRTASASPVLQVGSTDIVVNVTSDTATDIDLSDTKIDTNISKETFDALPKGVSFGSLLKTAPNVRPEALSGGFQIDGASGSENVFVIDGQEVTNFRTGVLNGNNNLPFELLQEVQVKSTGYEAEFGGATGGVINVVTAGGNNSWHGLFGISFTPQGLQGAPRGILNRYSTTSTGSDRGFEYFQPRKDGGIGYYPVAAINGPIVKDKLWFSTVYAPQVTEVNRRIDYYNGGNLPTRTVANTAEYQATARQEYAFARIDAQPSSKLRGYATFLWNPLVQDGLVPGFTEGFGGAGAQQSANFGGSIGVLTGPGLLSRQGGRQNANTVNGQVTWNPTNSLIINGRVGRTFLNEKLNSYFIPQVTRYVCSASGNPSAVAGSGCLAGFQNVSNNSNIDFDVSTRTTFDADASIVGVELGGRHNFKVGYQFNRLFNDVRTGYTGLGIITLFYGLPINAIGAQIGPTQPACSTTVTTNCYLGSGRLQRFGTVGQASSKSQSVFGQDSWQVNKRLTINLGLRLENETVPNFGDAANTQAIEFGWFDKVSPRIGVAFDLTGDGKTKLIGNYGWFYDRFKYELPRGSFGGGFFRRDFFEITPSRGAAYNSYTLANIRGNFTDPIGGQCPIVGGTGYSICQNDFRIATNIAGADIFETGAIDPDLKAARQSEFTFGLERKLGQGLLLAGRFTHKQVDRAIEDIGVFNAQGSEAYIIGNPGLGLACEVSTSGGYPCAKAERRYDAMEVRLDKRGGKYFYNLNYTLSRLFGNYSGLASSDEGGRTSPGVNRFFDLPPLGFNANGQPDNGRLATDRPHVFKAFAGYVFDWMGSKTNQTTISGFTTIQSGTPITTIYDLYSLGTTILYGRGDLGRTDMFTETDFSVSHRYKFGRDNRLSFEPFIQFRNLFDEKNELTRQASISTTTFTASNLSGAAAGCTVCTSELATFKRLFNGGIQQFVVNFLNANGVSGTGRRNDYNQTNGFQAPREVRFGMRLQF